MSHAWHQDTGYASAAKFLVFDCGCNVEWPVVGCQHLLALTHLLALLRVLKGCIALLLRRLILHKILELFILFLYILPRRRWVCSINGIHQDHALLRYLWSSRRYRVFIWVLYDAPRILHRTVFIHHCRILQIWEPSLRVAERSLRHLVAAAGRLLPFVLKLALKLYLWLLLDLQVLVLLWLVYFELVLIFKYSIRLSATLWLLLHLPLSSACIKLVLQASNFVLESGDIVLHLHEFGCFFIVFVSQLCCLFLMGSLVIEVSAHVVFKLLRIIKLCPRWFWKGEVHRASIDSSHDRWETRWCASAMIERLTDLVDLSEVAAQRHSLVFMSDCWLVRQREHILLTDAGFVAIVVVSIICLLIVRFSMVVHGLPCGRVPEIELSYMFVWLLRPGDSRVVQLIALQVSILPMERVVRN